jgi:hypothetical protein
MLGVVGNAYATQKSDNYGYDYYRSGPVVSA